MEETEEDKYNKLRLKCWNNLTDTFGYQYIFDVRSRRFSRRLNLLKVLGIIVPAAIGATALGYGLENSFLKNLLSIAIPITTLQFLTSVLAVIYKWDEELSYSFEASQAHNNLYRKYKKLAEFPPVNYDELSRQYNLIDEEHNSRVIQDLKHNLREREKRMGMRWSLREHQKTCIGCNKTPKSIESTDCPVCGQFESHHFILKQIEKL